MIPARAAIHGLYAVTPDIDKVDVLVEKVAAAISGGARVIQYRNKTAAAALRFAQATALQALCARHGVPLIINDHVDLAQRVDAAGVHIGADDGSLSTARAALGPHKTIGVSCYNALNAAQSAERGGADYVAFGSFFPSSVKPNAVKASMEILMKARRTLKVPIVAIGGITADNAAPLVEAGADAVAVISALFATRDVAEAARYFAALFENTHDTQR